MREIRRGRRHLRNWIMFLALVLGMAGCTVATSPAPPEELRAENRAEAIELCNTLDAEWIQACLTAVANTDWNE